MVALIQSENHPANKGKKTAGGYQFDTHPTGIGLTFSYKCNNCGFGVESKINNELFMVLISNL